MTQLDIFESPRAIREFKRDDARTAGEKAAAACIEKAETVSKFDRDDAGAFILATLRRNGDTPGEILTDLARKAGHIPHDDRAFGAVFMTLSKRGLIKCTGFCVRRKGHATAGGRIWAAT